MHYNRNNQTYQILIIDAKYNSHTSEISAQLDAIVAEHFGELEKRPA